MNNRRRKKKRMRSGPFRRWILPDKYREAFAGDLRELYKEMVDARGRFRAVLWLLVHLARSFVVLTGNAINGSLIMLKSYIRMAFRNLKKQPGFTLINIFGLAVGLSAAVLILFYLRFEMSYDRFHEKTDDLYRVSIRHLKGGDYESESHVFTPPIGEDMKRDFAEVEHFVRLSTRRPAYLTVNGKAYKEDGIRYASSEFFHMFSFPLRMGDEETVLADPFSIVLSSETAEKIFGTKNPLGEVIMIGSDRLYTVTGVVDSSPENSSIRFGSLLSFSTLYQIPNMSMDWNGGNQYITYVQLRDGVSPRELERKFPDFLWRNINELIAGAGWKVEATLQPLKKIHFYFDQSSRTALMNFTTFSAVAVFILLIACINFVNLTTARAARRAREVGLRKVVGAYRGNLIRQFLGESIVLTMLASVLGAALVFLLRPVYEHLLNRDLSLPGLISPIVLPGLIALVLAVGVLSGLYPALYLSSFQPVETLKGVLKSVGSKNRFRNILVVFQFSISVALIICTFLIQNQLRFMKKAELGFRKDNMVIVSLPERGLRTQTEEMRTELLSIPGVTHVTASSEVPYHGFTSNGYQPEGHTDYIMFFALDMDEHFLETYDIRVIKGRNFETGRGADRDSLIVNETLARKIGWNDPIGKTIFRNKEWRIIGVVKDFQFATLHDSVEPLIITSNPWGNRFSVLSVRLQTNDIRGTLRGIERIYKKFSPVLPFEYTFLDEAFDRLYRTEERFQKIFFYFSGLAICIALLGLFSLAAYAAQQKSKEIGIRKVLGATASGIVSLFTKEMVVLIVAANAVAWPVAYYVMQKWLGNFAYRAAISLWAFIGAFGLSLVASLLTISYQSLRAAAKNPVDELRSE